MPVNTTGGRALDTLDCVPSAWLRSPSIDDSAAIRHPRRIRCHTDNVRVQEAAELVAIDVFQGADKTGQRITLAIVERRVAELQAHAPACRCRLCEAAAKVRVGHVFKIASAWQGCIGATRRRAAR